MHRGVSLDRHLVSPGYLGRGVSLGWTILTGQTLCFTSHKVRTAEQKKVLKKRGAGGFFGLAVKNGRNYGPACLGLKMGEIQKFLFPQGFATLWPADG